MRRHRDAQSRRWWRRLERTAIAAYEREVLGALRRLAGQQAHCTALTEAEPNPAGIVRLVVQQRLLLMAGVLPAERDAIFAMQATGPLRLTEAGRYGRLWWISLSGGPEQRLVGVTRLRLTFDSGGGVCSDELIRGLSPAQG